MGKTNFARTCLLSSAAAVLMVPVVWSEAVQAQNAAATSAGPAATSVSPATTGVTTGAATPNAAGQAQSAAANAAFSGAPVDPGVRAGTPGAGGPLQGLSDTEIQFFNASKDVFNEVDAVPNGLGPRFNLDACAGCHAQPSVGGSAPATNPQVALATAAGAKNVVPSFITANGPVRVARFVRNNDGSPDGSVHALYTIAGRSDAAGCKLSQPNFAAAVASRNVIFRIPTPTFGLGLVENVSDTTLTNSLAANAQQKRSLGISGHFNINGNDTTIARFGWKAQNKSLLLFSGEAYNVEMGITNELFQNERESDPSCEFNALPESPTPLESAGTASPVANFQSDIVLFSAFMRLLAPPAPASSANAPVAASTPAATTASSGTSATVGASTGAASTMIASASADVSSVLPSAAGPTAGSASSTAATAAMASASGATVTRGSQVFSNVGCQACHTLTLTTGKSQATGQSNITIQPLSDFAVHDMGSGLADGVSQGTANGNEFRTAPLWGLGQRIFLLHDGRTKDLNVAIQQHSSRGSEANTVINNYNMLSRNDKQSLLNYLRSL
jgi:CxxC motif-containing protein (DUF1111 family)